MTHYAFVDVETTGLDVQDSSIVEIGIISTNERGEIFDRYETLINPLRKMAATKIHGIRATAISAAPTFELIAADVAERLDGAVVVACNARFDSSFVGHAMEEVGGHITRDWTCAMAAASSQLPNLSRRRLTDVAATLGLEPDGLLHSASADADLCARVFFALPSRPSPSRCRAAAFMHAYRVPPMPRSIADDQGTSRRPFSQVRSLEVSGPANVALIAELKDVFADNVVTLNEAKSVSTLIDSERLTAGDVLAGFNQYLEEEITAVLADGVVDAEERLKLRAISHHLGYPAPYIERRLAGEPAPSLDFLLAPGISVVFTGLSDEDSWDLTLRCAEQGVAIRHSVSKATDLVVYDGSPTTRKATKATELSIPLMPLLEF
ncbi:MAG: 3'-5' exonuclease, partial [Actinobacteria bacterium]|nr:3'-5' exonuclease [Actinomycetota bacterium]